MKNQKNKKPLGKPIVWSDTDLESLTGISAADLKAANALWKNEGTPGLANLLEATIEENEHGTSQIK